MELAYMILDEAQRRDIQQRADSAIVVTFECLFCKDCIPNYVITILPVHKQNPIVQYKKATFQCPNESSYKQIVDYLVNQIQHEIYSCVYFSHEFNDYIPEDDDNFNWYTIHLQTNNTTIFKQTIHHSEDNDAFERLKTHLLPYNYATKAVEI